MLYVARFASTHCSPRRTVETFELPVLSITRTSTMFACGAIPAYSPPDAVPSPAARPATCVPCPPGSPSGVVETVGDAAVKSMAATIRPARSGCDATPLSTTAMPTPLPVSPAAQTDGAPVSMMPGVSATGPPQDVSAVARSAESREM